MLERLETFFVRQIERGCPWGPSYALGRTLLAAAALFTWLANPVAYLFRGPTGGPSTAVCEGVGRYGLFCQPFELELARWVAIGGLVLVLSGWRPRWTGILHWWITVSLQCNATLVDGGESVASVLTLLLVPLTLTDGRKNHWHAPTAFGGAPRYRARLVALVASTLIVVQVCGIYAHAAIGKFSVDQWTNGTALYYWLSDGLFRAPDWVRPMVSLALEQGSVATLMTWSVLGLEFALGASLWMTPRARRTAFVLGCGLHLGIFFLQGIASFSMTMLGALVMGVWPHPDRLPGSKTCARVIERWRSSRAVSQPSLQPQPQPQPLHSFGEAQS